MEAFLRTRRFLHTAWTRFRPKRRLNSHHFIAGLPDGITAETLNKICLDQFSEKALSYSYQHLSGWKPTGAYRLLMKTHRGNEIRLIFKDSIYQKDQIPALAGLPLRPGPPEYTIYSNPTGAIAAFIPQVYLAEEITPGKHYRYLLEDLGQNYHAVGYQKEFVLSCYLLPKLHQALQDWSNEIKPQGFLQYGKKHAWSLQKYAHDNLVIYSQYSDDPILKSVLLCWPKIADLHLQEEFYRQQSNILIHGDTNYTNFFLHTQDIEQFRVVDWEWAGYGLPYADLASLLKSIPEDIEKTAFKKYINASDGRNQSLNQNMPFEENWRLYLWCQLERGILDASFLAVQYIKAPYPARFSLPRAVSQSLHQILKVYQQLS